MCCATNNSRLRRESSMKRWLQSLLLLALLAGASSRAPGQSPSERQTWNLRDPVERARLLEDVRVESDRARTSAWAMARAQGWRERGRVKGRNYQLRSLENGVPMVDIENNVNAAISTAANLIRNTAPYNVNGTNVTVGVWDGGGVRSTHQELTGRVSIMDGAVADDHATHVGGTIAASGATALALGMAPRVRIDSYEWTSDTAEMTARGMVTNAQSGRIPLSNHSYGSITGWDEGDWSGTYGVHWWGAWGAREADTFGLYNSTARSWDQLCVAAPYYLPFKSAGNDRNDNAPANGTTFYYYNGSWQSKTYDSATDPYSDGWDNGGYDTISTYGVAKNIMTVGSVADAVSGGNRSLGLAAISSFSGWGPADDGRIKPDVVANGESLYSSLAGSDSSYAYYSGTSMSTPNAAGTAALLVDYYLKLTTGSYMRASTLKGLLIHTADDLGNAGPDYRFGWGLLNAKAAADHLQRHFANPTAKHLEENTITGTVAARTNQVQWDATNAIRVTLSWTDIAGTTKTGLDNSNRCLVNDLNLRVIGPNGQTNWPYVMPFVQNRNNPAGVATNGVNNTDNIEQVYVASPSGSGLCSIVVERNGALSGTTQLIYSLVVSGVLPQEQDSVSLTITGVPYQVGSPMPGYGTTTNAYGSSTQAVVFGRATNVEATSWASLVCTGWTRTGSSPASGGTTNTGLFTLTANTTVRWHWVISDLIVSNQVVVSAVTNQPRDTLRARDGYSVVAPGSANLRAGSSVRLEDGFRAGTGSTVIIQSP
jgi:hypothetical protein